MADGLPAIALPLAGRIDDVAWSGARTTVSWIRKQRRVTPVVPTTRGNLRQGGVAPSFVDATPTAVFSVTIWGIPTQPQTYSLFLMKFRGVKSQHFVSASLKMDDSIGTIS